MNGQPVKISGAKSAAFFDVDGTLIHTTIVHYFIYFQLRRMPRWKTRIWYPWFLAKCGGYLALDKVNRTLLNRIVYRNYAGLPVAEIKGAAADCVRAISKSRWLVGARDAIQKHREAGARIVLVTGSLDFLMAPLAMELGGADALAATLDERDGRFTGELVGVPVIAEEKRRKMVLYADEHGLDMKQCHAYGDSSADLPMLEAVGFPHAVNPDRWLRAIACKRDWPIHEWPIEKNERGVEANRPPNQGGLQGGEVSIQMSSKVGCPHPHPNPLPERERESTP